MSTTVQSKLRVDGVVSLLLTPFTPSGSIDWSAYDAYVHWQLAQQPSALFAVCGSSEMKWLSLEERLDLAKRAVQLAGSVPVFATANLEPDTGKHKDEIAMMAERGVTAVVLVPPSSISSDQGQLCDYILNMADASPCPVALYEWPQVEHYTIAPETFSALALHPNIIGIKDTTCTLEGITAKLRVANDVIIYQANTPFLLEALKAGTRGIMAVTSAACASKVIQLWAAFKDSREEQLQLHRELVYLDALLRLAYPATAKYLVSLQGLSFNTYCRWPVTLTPEVMQALRVWQGQAVVELVR